MEINTSKTKVLSTFAVPATDNLTIDGELLEIVPEFKYLGSTILPTGQAKIEIGVRTDNARKAFVQLKCVLWRKKEISLKTKLRVYEAAIRPVLLYGCETWPLRAEDIRKLQVFDHWCLKYILQTRRIDQISNARIRARCYNICEITTCLRHRRLRWFGHVLRRPESDLTKVSLFPKPCIGWRCRSGGQIKTWIDTVKADLEQLGLPAVYSVRHWKTGWTSIAQDLAADRRAWAAVIRDIHEAGSSSRRR